MAGGTKPYPLSSMEMRTMSNIITPQSFANRTPRQVALPPHAYTGEVSDVVRQLAPVNPLYIMWPERIAEAAKQFLTQFPGETVYATKCNPDKIAIQTMYRAGVRAFDVASIGEVRLVRKLAPKAKLYFMHTIKSPEAIAEAYKVHGVRAFVLDSMDELYKIMRATELAQDLELFVRMALPKNSKAQIDFSTKFGALPYDAADLLKACRPVASRLGLCLHVGTQCTDPAAYKRAVKVAAQVLKASKVSIDVLDVGGGFPVEYPGSQPLPPFQDFVDTITSALKAQKMDTIPLMCEPGRALVANAVSLVVRVEGRKGNLLHINDGTYGGLFDAGAQVRARYATKVISRNGTARREQDLVPYRFAGPTCDSIDMMKGPFMLPSDIVAGDWIEIQTMGAYSQALRSNFNDFGHADQIVMKKI
ncbi:MAG: type III PLP-dependent enzyme [Alphaproteobacteria bacterium]|nr:type III PLP-dependent enzyme [Alphaproteobacteria bacterium]